LVTIVTLNLEKLFLSTAASLLANRASGPLGSPTANTSVSDFFSQIRAPHRGARQRQRQQDEQKDLDAIALDDPRPLSLSNWRDRSFDAHGCATWAGAALPPLQVVGARENLTV
jgi:hypothetical protein